ncbi:MAG: hypothetical protein ACRD51_04895 [Candidatus Acidiferrum sp.]
MRLKIRLFLGSAVFAGALLVASNAGAQQTQTTAAQANTTYEMSRETLLQGTVVSFTAASTVAPVGPHATIQTSSGVVEVQLGRASLLKQNNISLAPGDSVNIVGETETFGTDPVFLARVLRKGGQTVTLRNLNGIPLVGKPTSSPKSRSIFGGTR